MYWERGTPAQRRKLKVQKYAGQGGKCSICGSEIKQHGSGLDRFDPILGYTPENTRLLCHDCHVADQKSKRFK